MEFRFPACARAFPQVKAALLDQIARDPEGAADGFVTFESKTLREAREALGGSGGLSDAYTYAVPEPVMRTSLVAPAACTSGNEPSAT